MLSLPLFKWCALVESWLFQATEEKHQPSLQRELERPVDFTWIHAGGTSPAAVFQDPARWQTNKPGESLLSVHRKRRE